jgi:PhnB protein
MAVKPIPDGFRTVTPYLVAQDAAALIDFVKRAFGAQEKFLMRRPDGSVGHAEVIIGDSHVMIGQAGGPTTAFPAMLYLYVPDVDATFRQAVAAGGKALHEPSTQFYGDRHGAVTDSNGNQWWIATHVEDVSMEELKRRADAAAHQPAGTTA